MKFGSAPSTLVVTTATAAASHPPADHIPPELRQQMVDVSRLPSDKATEALIEHAVAMGASDLFLVCNEEHLACNVRHLGIIMPISIENGDTGRKILAHIRNMSGMDLSDRRRPADGRWIYRGDDGESVDLRINTIPTLYGEDMAIRLLVRGHALSQLDALGMTENQLQSYRQMIAGPSGLVLITGPTGSGKTATLYSSLIELNDGTKKINTIEDPVEYAVDGLRQSQVNTHIQLGFAELLRSVLRQSPDVIMIGEIRDDETAKTAVHAANSGILVLATLHAPSAAAAIQSMRAYGVPNHFLSVALKGIVSQRLLRTLDPASRVGFDISSAPETFDEIRDLLGPEDGKMLYAARPAPSNRMSGYLGRTGVFEVMNITRDIRSMISEGKGAREIREKAVADRMLEFRQSAMVKVARGQTCTEEVIRVIPSEVLLLDD